ncbi:hypothetical protein [Deinococcus sonorensis]|uniref:Uncharacterized protein n=2 Tax=Deinococcus sonorensis TaxID=309891 RepID=A0AAU7UCG8_9DEIO
MSKPLTPEEIARHKQNMAVLDSVLRPGPDLTRPYVEAAPQGISAPTALAYLGWIAPMGITFTETVAEIAHHLRMAEDRVIARLSQLAQRPELEDVLRRPAVTGTALLMVVCGLVLGVAD